MKNLHSNEWKEFCSTFSSWVRFLEPYVQQEISDGAQIFVSDNTSVADCTWDGEIIISFPQEPKAKQVVDLISHGRPDECSMEDEKTLRIWWD